MSMALGNWTTAKNIPLFLAQILAGKTLLIGCAKSSCPMTNEGQETIVVCEYWPKVSKGPLYSQGKFCENGNDCTLYAKSTCNTETRLCDTGDDIELNEFLQPIYSPKNITESTNLVLDFTPYQLPDDDMITNSSHEDEEKYIGFKHDLHRLRFLNAHKERRNQILKGITTLDAMNSEQIEFFFQLTWSDELEKKAFSDAEKCESLEPKSSRKYHRIIMDSFDFDNLTYILDREFSMTVQKWWSNPMDESDENVIFLKNSIIGLFLATELGCGFASCVDDNLRMAIDIVCHYWPTSDPSELYDYAIGCERDGDCASLINSHCNIEEKICVKNNL
ncbi:unnamed protein product [Dracunculus medinensis]|uniref:SCP domain-containing protein n=1 Tax=Dracunculus medinensis TaxID=318479 RepID=A0A0N4UCM5_DRAME|nr:unnamed protein product [Dracunculus medinensis]